MPRLRWLAPVLLLLPLAACATVETGPPHPMNRAWSAGTIDCTRTNLLPGDDPWATACPGDR